MSRLAKARGFAKSRIFEPGDPVPKGIGPAKWIDEGDGKVEAEAVEPSDNLNTRSAKALRSELKTINVQREAAGKDPVQVETDANKPTLIGLIRTARAEVPEE